MATEQNAYLVLNLRKGASEGEIKAAYIEMVKRYDPEKHTDRFMQIQSAYERLTDVKKRAKEDLLVYNYQQGEFHFSDDEKVARSLEEAVAIIREKDAVARQNPTDPSARQALVSAYMNHSFLNCQKKLWQEAINDWNAVLQIDPTHQRAKSNLIFANSYLGYYYALHDLLDESIVRWEAALQMDPDNLSVLHNLAIAATKSNNNDKAARYWAETLKRWKTLLDKNPGDEYLRSLVIEAHRFLGDRALDKPQVAIPSPTSSSAVSTSPQVASTSDSVVSVGAAESFREVLKYNPGDFEARFSLASTLMNEGKFAESIEELKKLQVEHPKNLDIMNLLGWAYLNSAQIELAFSTWRRAMAQDPRNHTIKDSMARARLAVGKKLKEGGQFTPALVHFRELQKLMPNTWEVHYEIAEIMMKKGDKRTALVEFQKVLELDPKNKLARKAINDLKLR
jgi:molecular chaperone DnaJ